MNHKQNYIDLHNGLCDFLKEAEEDKLEAWVMLGGMMAHLKDLISDCDDDQSDDQDDREEFVEKFKSCIDSLKELRNHCDK